MPVESVRYRFHKSPTQPSSSQTAVTTESTKTSQSDVTSAITGVSEDFVMQAIERSMKRLEEEHNKEIAKIQEKMKTLETDIGKINNAIEKMAETITDDITKGLQGPNGLLTTTVKTFTDRQAVMEKNTQLILQKLGIQPETATSPPTKRTKHSQDEDADMGNNDDK